jgi:hypothetical protein
MRCTSIQRIRAELVIFTIYYTGFLVLQIYLLHNYLHGAESFLRSEYLLSYPRKSRSFIEP